MEDEATWKWVKVSGACQCTEHSFVKLTPERYLTILRSVNKWKDIWLPINQSTTLHHNFFLSCTAPAVIRFWNPWTLLLIVKHEPFKRWSLMHKWWSVGARERGMHGPPSPGLLEWRYGYMYVLICTFRRYRGDWLTLPTLNHFWLKPHLRDAVFHRSTVPYFTWHRLIFCCGIFSLQYC